MKSKSAHFELRKDLAMKEREEKIKSCELEATIQEISEQKEREKEEKLIILITEIIVSATLKEYYEKSNKVSTIQSNRTE